LRRLYAVIRMAKCVNNPTMSGTERLSSIRVENISTSVASGAAIKPIASGNPGVQEPATSETAILQLFGCRSCDGVPNGVR